MALAKFFDKDILAISQVLGGGSAKEFELVLSQNVVEIAFDDSVKSYEGKCLLDLSVRLLSRLYPRLKFTAVANGHELIEQLKEQSSDINCKIEFTDDDPTVTIIIGNTSVKRKQPTFYVGSDRWLAKFSDSKPVGSGNSELPFAAGLAACLGAANIFRYVFRDMLSSTDYDKDIIFSLIDLKIGEVNTDVACLDIGEVTIAGIGAIGNGIIWALSYLYNTKGAIRLVDEQTLSMSNLQRYVITREKDEGYSKVEIASNFLSGTRLGVQCYRACWADYISQQQRYDHEMVLTALDSAEDRIVVQSSLPKYILNGFTEEGLLGISRHFNFIDQSCLCCAYMPSAPKKSKSQEVADHLGIPQHELLHVRKYLYYNSPVDESLLNLIAEANQIPIDNLSQYIGIGIREFYTNFVCGGVMLRMKGATSRKGDIEAPLAFQSAFAGILLASELYLFRAGIRTSEFSTLTHFYPLFPISALSNPYHHNLVKDPSGRCLCADGDFMNAFKEKWQVKIQPLQ